jgi:hypothetical protein
MVQGIELQGKNITSQQTYNPTFIQPTSRHGKVPQLGQVSIKGCKFDLYGEADELVIYKTKVNKPYSVGIVHRQILWLGAEMNLKPTSTAN